MEPPLVWIDCEMTGLDHKNDQIIEICCLLTDDNLQIIEPKGYEAVIHCPKEKLDAMSEWCVEHHGQSGLTQKCIESTKTMAEVEEELLAYIKRFIPRRGAGVLAGNSVHQDRVFLAKDMPKIDEYLHYRILDVSSIKEAMKRHNPKMSRKVPRKVSAHTARSDIEESIAELQWYYTNYFRKS